MGISWPELIDVSGFERIDFVSILIVFSNAFREAKSLLPSLSLIFILPLKEKLELSLTKLALSPLLSV